MSESPRTLEELLVDITLEYSISREAAEQDLQELIHHLREEGLIEAIDENSAAPGTSVVA
jgi:hypothetical protein